MKINTNTWNKCRYTLYSPFYNLISRVFLQSRQKAIGLLAVKPGEKVLLIGAGTGLDLDFLPPTALITATDITPAMVARLIRRGARLQLPVNAQVMDGQCLTLPDNAFDKIVLHLILAVIPDPVRCLQEAERVLKPGGQIVVFDKFLQPGHQVGFFRRVANFLTNFLFSNITRRFENIVAQTNLKVSLDQPANFGGNFRIILLQK
ncbi:SAM-dependent methyltransferase [Adhaeribacter aerolatus]|uniref:SAM-dependent methyltransferase n=1 Tax=Adhaeribacter aerolatus TaxID=670289 RepID=A0A512B3R2_9BACT|nr:methyltransferase domain-containing protein [Adhaeribacter aerolatus]GEO06595.1 SAM-dependent methyltransferase [Adhaeribacter aerolatus]